MTLVLTEFWKRPKIWILGFTTFVVLLIISFFILTSSFVLSKLVANSIGQRLNAVVDISHAKLSWSGLLELEGVSIHVKEVEGPASRIVFLDSTIVQLENLLPWQTLQVRSIQTDNATIRVAESELVAGEFNLSSVFGSGLLETRVVSSPELVGQIEPLITTIDLEMLTLEIGTMNKSSWKIEDSVEFEVEITETLRNAYDINLQNIDGSLNIEGTCNTASPEFTLVVDPMQLDDGLFSLLPKTARLWCDAIKLQGDIGELSVAWNEKTGLEIEVDIDVIEFNLPEVHSIQWAHYEDGQISRMQGESSLRVEEGRIIFGGKSAILDDLRGVLLPPQSSENSSEIPFQATIEFTDLPSLNNLDGNQWMETMLETSPFSARFQIDGFRSKKKGAGQVDLPLVAAKALQLFHLKDWNVNAELVMVRQKQGGDIEKSGKLAIIEGTGKYDGFPYPLRDVKALIYIQDDSFVIQTFDAIGSEGATVSIVGEVNSIEDQVGVNITLTVRDAPLDEALHDAVSKPVATVMERFLDQEALNRLVDKGIVEEGDFILGGTVDMELSIKHSGKKGDSVEVSGDLVFTDTSVIHDGFPFPITIENGSVRLEPNKLEIPFEKRITFHHLGGGRGVIVGSIDFDNKGQTQPNLVFRLLKVPITNVLIEAVAVSSGDSYNTVQGVLGGLGLNGLIDAIGEVTTNENGEIERNIKVTILKSKAMLQPKLAEAIHCAGPFWEEGFILDDVSAQVVVTNEGVWVSDVCGSVGAGEINASMDILGGDYKLRLQGTNWPISDNLVYLLPPSASEKLAESWFLLEPSGFLNADLRIINSNGESDFHLKAVPSELGISGDNKKVVMTLKRGEIVVDNSRVYLNDLSFSLDQNGEDQGVVGFDGSIRVTEEKNEFDITGNWENAFASSPLARAITGIIGGQDALGYYDSLSPTGIGYVTMATSQLGDQSNYKVVIVPEILSAEFGDRKAIAQFSSEESEGTSRIIFDNRGITLDHLEGKLGDGVFAIGGNISTDQRVHGTFQLDWDGPSDDQSLFAVLPPIVGDTLIAMEIGEGTSKVDRGVVTLLGTSWSELTIDFEGDILLQDVSMNAGIPLSNIYGSAGVEGIYYEEKLESLQLHLKLDKMTAVGRQITRIEGGLVLDPSKKRMKFDPVRGHSSSGVVTISGWVGVDDLQQYEMTALLDGVLLEDDDDEVTNAVSEFKGEMTGWLSMKGVRGDVNTRYGIGELRVTNGMFAEVPLSMRAMQLLQLTLPTTESISSVLMDIFIEGDNVVLDQIKLSGEDSSSTALVFKGSGTITIPSFELDIRLYPRAGWPLVRDITGAFGDQLISIDVTGKLLDPTISVVPLPFLSPNN